MAAKGLGADCPTVVAPENRNVMGAAGSRPDPPASDTKPVPCAFPAHRSLPIITGGSLLRHATRSGHANQISAAQPANTSNHNQPDTLPRWPRAGPARPCLQSLLPGGQVKQPPTGQAQAQQHERFRFQTV